MSETNNNETWALYGVRYERYQELIGGNFKTDKQRELVALFSSRQKAEEYVRAAKLKTPRQGFPWPSVNFRKNSLLRYYNEAEVELYWIEEPNPPFDPEPGS